ncbi:MAG: DoxX family protein [Planctomycetaceae bacterium]
MSTKLQRIIGWVMTALIEIMLIGLSGIPKFMDFPGKKEMLDRMGISADLLSRIGVVEIAVAILFMIPRTSFIGAILITGYLGGAIMTHLRIGDPWVFPVILGVFMWIALGLRNPVIFTLALGKNATSQKNDEVAR